MARSKVTTAHVDKSLNVIYKSEWEALREDKEYWLLGQAESKSQKVEAIWLGRIENAHKIPKSKWAPYALEVSVISTTDSDGRELKEPKVSRDPLACEQFRTFEDLKEAYNAYIAKYMGLGPEELSPGKPDPAPPEPEPEDDDDYSAEDEDYSDDDSPVVAPEKDKPDYDIPDASTADVVSGGIGGDW